ncbi:MAG: hypothetical protein IJZ47_05395 [Oscillospiraceae bacterium]|nr:hypothetical protein [Oscillospiraceae bacterium]
MRNLFQGQFSIKVDTSACKSIIADYDIKLNDTWYYSDQSFESGKIYGLVSEYGQGGMYLSHLLGGKVDFQNVKIYCNDHLLSQDELNNAAWDLEPYGTSYGNKTVRRSIEKALLHNSCEETFQTIADRFLLTPERYDRKFKWLSGERWRASAAFGYAQNKKVFYAPYNPSNFYYQMCQSGLLKALRELTDHGAVVILPTGSDEFIKHIADEVIFLNRKYDMESLRLFYSQQYNRDWIR